MNGEWTLSSECQLQSVRNRSRARLHSTEGEVRPEHQVASPATFQPPGRIEPVGYRERPAVFRCPVRKKRSPAQGTFSRIQNRHLNRLWFPGNPVVLPWKTMRGLSDRYSSAKVCSKRAMILNCDTEKMLRAL